MAEESVNQQPTLPPEVAVDYLSDQLRVENTATAASAIDALNKAALNSTSIEIRVRAIRALGDYASNWSGYDRGSSGELRRLQAKARDRIASISFGSDQAEVQGAALAGLAQSLKTPDYSEGPNLQQTVQLITIIGATSGHMEVKNTAIQILGTYGSKGETHFGYPGGTGYKNTIDQANAAIGVISKMSDIPQPSTSDVK